MAIYDLSSSLSRETAILRFKKLLDSGEVIELKKKETQRTIKQNQYLHLLLQYAAIQLGETLDYTKRAYYKFEANRDLYLTTKYDENLKRDVAELKSSRDLTTEEMALSIDRFKHWCAEVPAEPFYLPDADDKRELLAMEIEVERNKQFI